MDVGFGSEKLAELCNTEAQLIRKYGKAAARKISRRLQLLLSQQSLEGVRGLPGDCHELKGKRRGQLAIDVSGSLRLIIEPAHNPSPRKPDGGLDWSVIKRVRVIEVDDYH